MKFAFKIAFRFLKASKAQTALIVLGIAIGVSVQVFIGSLIQGLQASLIDTTIGNASQVTINSKNTDKILHQWKDIIIAIKESETSIEAIVPTISFPAFIEIEAQAEPILLRGFNLEEADKIYKIAERIYEGALPLKENEVVIGKDLKELLMLSLGDEVTILTPTRGSQEMYVVGFYDLKVATINQSWVITNLETVQSLYKVDNGITAIEMQVVDVFEADTIAANLREILEDYEDIVITDWKSQNQQLLSGLQGQSVSSLMIQIFVLIAVVLGIASVLAISVLQKSKQLGILKAMGVKDSVASLIFLLQGFMLGIVGGILGIVLGLGLGLSFTYFALNPDGTPIVPLYIDYSFIAISAMIAIMSATIAALIPARKSSRLTPMEVIKNG